MKSQIVCGSLEENIDSIQVNGENDPYRNHRQLMEVEEASVNVIKIGMILVE